MKLTGMIDRLAAGLMLFVTESNDPMNNYPLIRDGIEDITVNIQSWLWIKSPSMAETYSNIIMNPIEIERIGRAIQSMNIREKGEIMEETIRFLMQMSDMKYLEGEFKRLLNMLSRI